MTPRGRARLLLREAPAGAPLFLPIAHRVAAAIESLGVEEFLCQPTKLSRGLEALHQALATDGIVTGSLWDVDVPDVTEIERHPRVAASMETTRRLAATVKGEPILAVVLPADLDGAVAVELGRRFCEAGANAILLLAGEPPPGEDALREWASTATTLGKVVRFHQALPLLVSRRSGHRVHESLRAATARFWVHPAALSLRPHEWVLPADDATLVTTAGEIPESVSVAELRESCLRVRQRGTGPA